MKLSEQNELKRKQKEQYENDLNEIKKLVLNLKKGGRSFLYIANELNRRGYKTEYNCSFRISTIQRLYKTISVRKLKPIIKKDLL
jgi:hypothetical protein